MIGTTAAGKTTVGVYKFMVKVSKSEDKYHQITMDEYLESLANGE